ncbi:MAG: ribose-5-phosphate isomerase RpiA [Chlamydiia bacterium]|nr:ribose-5-phosphate isomerase RpiA [Chlamydiia bacterium]
MKLGVTKQEEIKKSLGETAATFVKEGMLVGLGSGTTASFFIDALIKRCQEGLNIKAVSSSIASLKRAEAGGIHTLDMKFVKRIDLTIDGADEIDSQNRMIKGGGGALTREKIIASSSDKMIVIVDESKLVKALGCFGLPLEILPFGYLATIEKLQNLGYSGSLRLKEKNIPYITDNQNYIFDVKTPDYFDHPEKDHVKIIQIPGVIETGFFFHLASKVLVGYSDGKVNFR